MQNVPARFGRAIAIAALIGAAVIGSIASVASAHTQTKTAPVNSATEIHGLPGNNPAHGGTAASPNGTGHGGGGGIHNIAGGAPGHEGASAAEAGQPPACTIHGGMANNNGVKDNRNCLSNQ